ncbi:2-amino-4-hydroxy-6-hydroxymethyldihydropteridine diphosphokinase [Govanella unica]|uniref:2-amino-4-hydroxy-6-hydroxymethyldihydropteridine pyrophosphokinase n=1 Tax=Govanella unica TaxID=2975056 RepID=A0A9X3TYV7_9PROT|nr:2-amino-4-hydroxy-6-hydroxymethyldihydropteridine diphosphokinase [Govania unica]MDA5194260.1 2-amino-4-hydroxy-6-hydroxymethyldihydropteridine diphosphokinase [Govania unica]
MIFVALGANLPSETFGPPAATLDAAVRALEARGLRLTARSRWFESEPVPRSDQPWFVNGVVAFETALPPAAILQILHEVEAEFGRIRRITWEARILDLDLIACDDLVLPNAAVWQAASRSMSAPELVLPHPRAHLRSFVLLPLLDIAPDWRHPVLGLDVRALLAGLPPEKGVVRPLPDRC